MNRTRTGPKPSLNRSKSDSNSIHMNLNRQTVDIGPEPKPTRGQVYLTVQIKETLKVDFFIYLTILQYMFLISIVFSPIKFISNQIDNLKSRLKSISFLYILHETNSITDTLIKSGVSRFFFF